jgi:hypothetical protein
LVDDSMESHAGVFPDEYTLCCGLAVKAGLSESGDWASGCLQVLYSIDRVHLRRVIALLVQPCMNSESRKKYMVIAQSVAN